MYTMHITYTLLFSILLEDIQVNLDGLFSWALLCSMKFGKCKVKDERYSWILKIICIIIGEVVTTKYLNFVHVKNM